MARSARQRQVVTAMNTTLEQRIATALSSDTTSDAISILIAEVETAIVAADKTAEAEREKALDPLASPDAAKAALRWTTLPSSAAGCAPCCRGWKNENSRVPKAVARRLRSTQGRSRRVGGELRDIYPAFAIRIIDLFTRIAANDVALSRLHQARPAGCALHLAEAELAARNIECFSRANPSIAKTLQLPDFDHSAQLAWPPPKPSMTVQVATSMTYGLFARELVGGE